MSFTIDCNLTSTYLDSKTGPCLALMFRGTNPRLSLIGRGHRIGLPPPKTE